MTTTKQSGGLPERHKAHLSRPPIAKKALNRWGGQWLYYLYNHCLLHSRHCFPKITTMHSNLLRLCTKHCWLYSCKRAVNLCTSVQNAQQSHQGLWNRPRTWCTVDVNYAFAIHSSTYLAQLTQLVI